MARRASHSYATSAEALEAAAHPDGVLRGIAARRAFTEIIGIQAACRGYLARVMLAPALPQEKPRVPPSLPDLTPPPEPQPTDSSELITTPETALQAKKYDGPEHTLVDLAIEIKSTKKEIATIEHRITDVTSEISLRESRVVAHKAAVEVLIQSINTDYVPLHRLEKLQEEVDEQNRQLDGWIAREAARKGKLIQLRTQVHAKAKLQDQWHRKRSMMHDHWPLEAEQMLKESITRAGIYIAAACGVKSALGAGIHRDLMSKTHVKLNRTRRSPYAPALKSPPPTPSAKPPTLKAKAIALPIAPPSSFHMEPGLQNEVPLGDGEEGAFVPKRRTRPVSVVVPDQNREEMNARLADFYVHRPKSSSGDSASAPRERSASPPPVVSLLDQIPTSVFDETELKLDLDLKLPTLPIMKRADSTPPSAFLDPPTSSGLPLPKPRVQFERPSVPPLLPRRSSKRAIRHSMPPAPSSAPVLAPLTLSRPLSPLSPHKNDPTKHSRVVHSSTPPNIQDFRISTTPFVRQTPAAVANLSNGSLPKFTDGTVPEWLNELLTPLQHPRRTPSAGSYAELVLDLRIPTYPPNSTTPPAEHEEWDVVRTSPFADRESFTLTAPSAPATIPEGGDETSLPHFAPPTDGSTLYPGATRDITATQAQNPRVAKLRNRASYILPKARNGSMKPVGEGVTGSDATKFHGLVPSAGRSHADSYPTNTNGLGGTAVGGAASGGKWRKRLSLTAILPHRSSHEFVDTSASARPKKGSTAPSMFAPSSFHF